jgi:hypothetical protein
VHLAEHTEGPYRIYTGALEARQGDGYIAALIVKRMDGALLRNGREAFRDESLACGHRWESAEEALNYAKTRAREVIAKQAQILAC